MPNPIALTLLCFFALWTTTPSAAITFAGVSGESPKFIEAGEDRGMGWAEVETKEIRKGMKVDGFNLKQDWMTHSRIEYEIRQNHPICTYPYEWKPQAPSAKDRIYSIPLKLSGEAIRSIYFNREDAARFNKHLDSNGNIKIQSLLADPSLSTRLVLARDYGTISKIVMETDAQGEAHVKKEFESHIELRVLRETHQLVEMLRAKRFDYLLSDSFGKEDFTTTHIPEGTFEQLPYETLRIKDKTDPNLALVSIACSKHPESLRAMPYLNKWIARFRGTDWITANLRYRGMLEPSFEKDGLNWEHTLTGRLSAELISGQLDPKGFQLPAPQRAEQSKASKTPHPVKHSPQTEPIWKAFELRGHQLAILSTAQIQALKLRRPRRNFDHRLMDLNRDFPQASLWLNLTAAERDEIESVKAPPATQAAHFRDLFPRPSSPENLILFAQGLSPQDLGSALSLLEHPTLKEVRIFGATTDSGSFLVEHLPASLTRLDLTHSSLTESKIQNRIPNMPLKALHLDSTQLTQAQLLGILQTIPETLEELSLSHLLNPWNLEAAKAFGTRRWTQLKKLELESDWLADQELFEIIKGLPPTLETLKLGGNIFTGRALAALLKRPFPKLTHLGLSMNPIASIDPKNIIFPPSIRQLELSHTQLPGGSSSLTHNNPTETPEDMEKQNRQWLTLATLPPQLELLDVSYNDLSPDTLRKLLSHLAPKVLELNLEKTQLNKSGVEVLSKAAQLGSIETLDLSSNQLDDLAIETLSKSKFQIESLLLRRNRIRNRGAKVIAEKWLPNLNTLELSENPISEAGIHDLSLQISAKLRVLGLAQVLSLDSNELFQKLPQNLLELNLAGNLLTDHQLMVLAPRLPMRLISLDLSTSLLTEKGILHLIHHLPPHLHDLNLSQVPVPTTLASQLLEALPLTLGILHLSDLNLNSTQSLSFAKELPSQLSFLALNRVQVGADALIDWFRQFPRSLENLHLTQVQLPHSLQSKGPPTPIQWPGNLRILYLWETRIDKEQYLNLFKSVPPSIQELQLWGSQMTDPVLQALADHPMENLNELDLMFEKISRAGMRTLVQRVRHLRELGALNLPISGMILKEIDRELLSSLRQIYFAHLSFSQEELIAFVKKLHPDTWMICIPSNGITLSGVPALIRALPKNLRQLMITGNSIGKKGLDQLRAYKKEREEQDGVPFRLIE